MIDGNDECRFGCIMREEKSPLRFTVEDVVHSPCGIAHFPKSDCVFLKEWVERGYNVQRWTAMPRGGHFAAAEQPELLAADVRAFSNRYGVKSGDTPRFNWCSQGNTLIQRVLTKSGWVLTNGVMFTNPS
jgi:hypothetical protein